MVRFVKSSFGLPRAVNPALGSAEAAVDAAVVLAAAGEDDEDATDEADEEEDGDEAE